MEVEKLKNRDTELLDAIHGVELKVVKLESKIDDSVNGRFKDNERRIHALENNQRWLVLTIVGMFLSAVGALILK